jgi:hypothetical protein
MEHAVVYWRDITSKRDEDGILRRKLEMADVDSQDIWYKTGDVVEMQDFRYPRVTSPCVCNRPGQLVCYHIVIKVANCFHRLC